MINSLDILAENFLKCSFKTRNAKPDLDLGKSSLNKNIKLYCSSLRTHPEHVLKSKLATAFYSDSVKIIHPNKTRDAHLSPKNKFLQRDFDRKFSKSNCYAFYVCPFLITKNG